MIFVGVSQNLELIVALGRVFANDPGDLGSRHTKDYENGS